MLFWLTKPSLKPIQDVNFNCAIFLHVQQNNKHHFTIFFKKLPKIYMYDKILFEMSLALQIL